MCDKFIRAKAVISIFIILFLVALTGCTTGKTDQSLTIHAIDVGQGDSILIVTPNQKTILIDAGEPSYGREVVRYIKGQGLDQIDVLIGTHPHADHIGGIPEVIESFRIGNFFMPARLHTTDSYERVLEAAAKKGLTINTAKRGIQLTLDENLHIQFLSPISDDYDSLNNWSAVLRIEYIDKVFLFTGDAEALLEKEIIESYAPAFLKANFLKVAHHGSNSSTTQQLLDIVDPEIAVMSLGKDNPYGFPHSEVIDRLSKAGIAIYRTDLQGNIVVKSDGNEIWSYQKPLSPNKR